MKYKFMPTYKEENLKKDTSRKSVVVGYCDYCGHKCNVFMFVMDFKICYCCRRGDFIGVQ